MKISDILTELDRFAPFLLAEEWDNVGLMVGDPNRDVVKLAVALDPRAEAIVEARQKNCQALLTHHPLFFKPLRKLDFTTPCGRAVEAAVKYEVALMAAHTNWDSSDCGVNKTLAALLGLTDLLPLIPQHSGSQQKWMGLTGTLSRPYTVRELLDWLKKSWNLSWLHYYGPAELSVKRVSFCGGAGGDLWPLALDAKADLYVTADCKYHDIADLLESGLPLVVVDHGEMERASLGELAARLAAACGIEVELMGHHALGLPMIK